MPPSVNSHPATSSQDWTHVPFEGDLTAKGYVLTTPPTSNPTSDPKSLLTNSSPSLRAHQNSTSPDLGNNTLQPPNAASPAFSFDDYLTPEFSSSENPYSEQSHQTTPSADELWHEDYKNNHPIPSQEPHPLDSQSHDNYFLSSTHDAFGSKQTLDSSRSSGENLSMINHALLTPEMSTASMTPERSTRPKENVSLVPHQLDVELGNYERARQGHPSDSRSPSQKRKADDEQHSGPLVVSPVVMVSTYNRGDSPARSQVPLSRNNSKRSQSSRLGNHTDASDEQGSSNLSSRLMPPANIEHDSWDQEDEQDNQRAGIAPGNRNADFVPSINDLERQRELDEKSADVEHWLATSAAGSPAASDDEGRLSHSRRNRIRSRSTGARVDNMGLQIFSDAHIPGPGALIDEDSTYYYSDGDDDDASTLSADNDAAAGPESPPAQIKPDEPATVDGYFPPVDEEIAPEDDEPLPRQFVRQTPWQDTSRGLPVFDKSQPPTANHAIASFQERAARFETASRAATWGTRRRLSDSEIGSILDGSSMTRHLSLKDTFAERARARGSSIINTARKVLPGRSSSFVRRHSKQASPENKSPPVASPEPQEERNRHRDSVGSTRQTALRRLSSRGKSKPPKSPPLSTSNAFMAMTGHLTAMGGNAVHLTAEPESSQSSRSPLLGALKRVRSKSDVAKSPKATHGLSELFTKHGGPPAPLLASPLQMRESSPKLSAGYDDDADDDGLDDEAGIKMDLPVQAHNIIPTLEGFKTHARQLNPRLDPYLIERIGQDQLKRFKRLVKNKVDHAKAVQTNKCSSAHQCLSLGGKATILPPRTNGKDAPSNFAQFKVAPGGDSDNDEASFTEGVVTPALFPVGIPLPPTSHLPAQFECPLCFQVKKFQKPSDWTKHVHEDVQPFSCTFANCPEPKSFKRKADWVRHENERHRHLEWWKCSVQECAHVCYRKDNFVQHLVREHKMTEPKGKGSKSGTSRVRSMSRNAQPGQGHNDFWQLVDSCRKETSLTPKNEPCKFCGNICSSWKKLSVHVGKHMEQIAMPVLNLADRKKVSAETVISPVEPVQPQVFPTTSIDSTALVAPDHFQHSPYTGSVHSNYQGSSAGHSPTTRPAQPHVIANSVNPVGSTYYGQTMDHSGIPPGMVPADRFANDQAMGTHYHYPTYDGMAGSEYMTTHQHEVYGPGAVNQTMTMAYSTQQLPRSQPMTTHYDSVTGMPGSQSSAYNPQPSSQPPPHSQVPYFGNTAATTGAYLANYGSEMGHQPDTLNGTHPRHGSHGHTPGSTSNADNTLAYYPGPQQGTSGRGYY